MRVSVLVRMTWGCWRETRVAGMIEDNVRMLARVTYYALHIFYLIKVLKLCAFKFIQYIFSIYKTIHHLRTYKPP